MQDLGISVNVHVTPTCQFDSTVHRGGSEPYSTIQIRSQDYCHVTLFVRYQEIQSFIHMLQETANKFHIA
jgi:hypothetical protein